jgi:hypothetical protein
MYSMLRTEQNIASLHGIESWNKEGSNSPRDNLPRTRVVKALSKQTKLELGRDIVKPLTRGPSAQTPQTSADSRPVILKPLNSKEKTLHNVQHYTNALEALTQTSTLLPTYKLQYSHLTSSLANLHLQPSTPTAIVDPTASKAKLSLQVPFNAINGGKNDQNKPVRDFVKQFYKNSKIFSDKYSSLRLDSERRGRKKGKVSREEKEKIREKIIEAKKSGLGLEELFPAPMNHKEYNNPVKGSREVSQRIKNTKIILGYGNTSGSSTNLNNGRSACERLSKSPESIPQKSSENREGYIKVGGVLINFDRSISKKLSHKIRNHKNQMHIHKRISSQLDTYTNNPSPPTPNNLSPQAFRISKPQAIDWGSSHKIIHMNRDTYTYRNENADAFNNEYYSVNDMPKIDGGLVSLHKIQSVGKNYMKTNVAYNSMQK